MLYFNILTPKLLNSSLKQRKMRAVLSGISYPIFTPHYHTTSSQQRNSNARNLKGFPPPINTLTDKIAVWKVPKISEIFRYAHLSQSTGGAAYATTPSLVVLSTCYYLWLWGTRYTMRQKVHCKQRSTQVQVELLYFQGSPAIWLSHDCPRSKSKDTLCNGSILFIHPNVFHVKLDWNG